MSFPTSSIFLALAAVGTASAAAVDHPQRNEAKNVTNFIAFGDSYTDACSSSQAVPTDKDSPVQAAYKGEWTIQNLAQSAATCDNAVFPRAPINDVGQQIDLLKTNYNTTQPLDKIQTDPATTWAAIFIGTNDISFYNSTADVAKETDCLERRIQTLHDFGHRKFLILENINLEYVPTYSTNGVVNKTIQSYTSGNRKSQAQLAEKLNKKWQSDGTEVLTFPTFELFSRMYNNPREYGMEYVKVPCVTGTGNNTVTCSHPTKYLWWNDLHPSFHAEQILAAKVVKFLEEGARGEDLLAGPQ
ncbi:uncharacterized protein PSFLO_06279 [Pseudozyma flocculosa]|uniref:SGNH hydrolase-type esterase domain-containing protein n=1 Tax=Pseudozyma flocculosa TaxID=84751 RepID=A0A5C3FAR7_9BASI|nr:uncharacterized protein PSFLO_06279 [Pseudozyma flocculosa]